MRVLMIINLKSGQGDAGIYDFARELGKHGTEIVVRFLGPKQTLASMLADAKEFDRVVAAGGDGTVSGIAYKLRGSGVPIVAYPAGTANLTALNLRIPLDPIDLAAITLRGAIRSFDLGEISCPSQADGCVPTHASTPSDRPAQGFAVAAGIGFDAKIMEGAHELKSSIGAAAYLVAALQNLTPVVAKFHLQLDDHVVDTEGIAVLVVNFAKLQFDISITHDSDPSDGVFEVVVLRTRNAIELLPAVWAAVLDRTTGIQFGSPGLEIYSARDIIVSSDPPLPLQHDGETAAPASPLHFRVLHRAATFVVPEE
ncbi:MAG: diacylglycerol kinase family protein [Coriobacteriia bacterium]|nr:diacylglycerol kinase family protein [Coriobacteriia bacterium]